MQHTVDFDILIVGAGIVGLSLALALAQRTKLKIAILDNRAPQPSNLEQFDTRVSAVNRASQHFFTQLATWTALQQQRISPYKQMKIWDVTSHAALTFACEEIAAPDLGHIIEHQVLQSVLLQQLNAYTQVTLIAPVELVQWYADSQYPSLQLADGRCLSAHLFIAADGANSWLRQQAQIAVTQQDYEQTALVATIKTQLPHQATAYQVFLPTGPLAFLPLAEPHSCSIVWSTNAQQATHLLAITAAEFEVSLATAFQYRLGEVQLLSQRQIFPLRAQQVKQYIQPGLALVGDAAHTVHPFAGQGLNMGLADAAALADIIAHAQANNRDFAGFEVLRKYERRSRAENKIQLYTLEKLRCLFADQTKPLPQLRQWGLNFLNQYQFFKKPFIWRALGAKH